ncbi:hypothetical protein ABEB36_013967 [Hypothenemus hampei]|uniref:THAP-type domain-containing protein n=1 Tax=Hypothenemus hampei TaxID=57062 RepID=A0ABD1E2W8_HYPHA
MALRRLKYRCIVPSCNEAYVVKKDPQNNTHFFRVSKARHMLWQQALKCYFSSLTIPKGKSTYICDRHFADNAFTRTDKSRLHKSAIPSIFQLQNNQFNFHHDDKHIKSQMTIDNIETPSCSQTNQHTILNDTEKNYCLF